ncbi:hypothetical protein [Sedimentisphaera cyanobacteriorum]|uniref:hypothetical protein n=1 Tax=Sedimentisphaera cyanobacteriorum TaxID=1940790 RepID=UPI000F504CDA|nr:hypothetical protein [Sedimentisphaera cyanobacteriorum]
MIRLRAESSFTQRPRPGEYARFGSLCEKSHRHTAEQLLAARQNPNGKSSVGEKRTPCGVTLCVPASSQIQYF